PRADPNHRIGIRFVTPNAWTALFVYNMFLRPTASDLAGFAPAWQVLHAPELDADPAVHGTNSTTFIVISFARRTILIGGTRYAGELKKSSFTILNYVLPKRGVLAMQSDDTRGEAGDRPRVRGDHGEYPRVLPDPLHPQSRPRGHGGAPVAHRVPDVRRLRHHASHRAALAGPGDVPLPLGLHRQGGGDGARSDRAERGVLCLLR